MASAPLLHATLSSFSEIWSRRSAHELHQLAHIKRFMECVMGDPAFRVKLEEHIEEPDVVAREYGIHVDPDQLRPLYHGPYMSFRFEKADDRWPLAKLWDRYIAELLTRRDLLLSVGDCLDVNPRFHRWRRRQIARVRSELGQGASGIVHPLVAYELSKGCTVGCWFCGISAEKFGGYLPFTAENEVLWRAVLRVMMARFGTAAQTGFCYWATDPSDNPDYVKFLRAHREETGVVPQTTTAAPLKNLQLTRDVLQLFDQYKCILNRFSIISVGQLRRVHATFTAEELLGVELVLQNQGALTTKAAAGRASERPLVHRSELKGSGARDSASAAVPAQTDGTIACVSGFLVNMVERRLQLVSPTRASNKWRNGYRIYAETQFNDAEEFARALDAMIEEHMPESLCGRDRLAFRDDLAYEAQQGGFRLANDRGHVAITGSEWSSSVGNLIRAGDRTTAQIIAAACAERAGLLDVANFLDGVYQAGLLNDDPSDGRIGGRVAVPT